MAEQVEKIAPPAKTLKEKTQNEDVTVRSTLFESQVEDPVDILQFPKKFT